MPASSDPTSFSYGTPAGPDTGDLTGATSTNSLGGIFNSGSTSALQTLSIVITNILSDNKKIAFEPYGVQFTLSDGTTGYSALHYATAIELGGLNNLGDVVITGTPADNEVLAYDTTTSKWINQTAAEANIVTSADPVITGTISGNAFLDEDDMSSNSAVKVASQQSIKAYVDSSTTAQDLDFSGDSGGAQAVDLDSQSLTLTGGTGIDTTGSSQTMTFAIDSTVATLAGSQTLTNKTLTSPVLNTGVSGTAIKDEDNMASDSATHLATQQSIKAYVDAHPGDITGVTAGSGMTGGGASGDVTLNVIGGTGITANADDIAIDSTVATLVGSQVLTNKSIDSANNTITNIVNADIKADAAIAITKLASSSVNYGGVTLSLGGSDTTPAFDLADATNYPTSSLTGTITNAQLAGSIANAKLTNSSITVSDGSNSTATSLGGTITFSGTTNEVEVGESSGTVTVGLPNNVTIAGNLTVNGDTTTVNTETLSVEDPLIKLANGNNAADSVDIGFYGLYDTSGSQDLYAGLFRDANDSGKFKLFKDLQTEPTTTVNTGGTGYAAGTLVASLEGNVTGNVSGTAATVTSAAQPSITSLGTLTTLSVDNITINGNDISSTAGTDLTITPLSGQQIVLDGTIVVDAGVVTGATSITSDAFVGPLTGNVTGDASGNAATATTATNATNITLADESSDTTCFPIFATAATSHQAPKTGSNLTFNSSNGLLTATSFAGDLTGDVTGNVSGTAATVTGAAQGNITSVGTLTGLTIDGDATLTGASYNVLWDKSDNALEFADNAKLTIGTGADLTIRHDSSNNSSYIEESGTGHLIIKGDDVYIQNEAGNTNIAFFQDGGGVKLFHNSNTETFKTTGTGVDVTGTLAATAVTGDGSGLTNIPAASGAQTTITSMLNNSLVVGRDADNDIDFGTDNEIIFRAAGADQIKLTDGALVPITNNDVDLGTASLQFKNAYFDGTVTTDGTSNVGNLTNSGYLWQTGDASFLYFGLNYEVYLRHVHDTGLLLNGAMQLQFGDSGTYIHQSADGVLDLVSDTEIEINATTIDMNGAVDISSTTTLNDDVTFTGANYNVVWDKSDDALEFADNAKATFGTGGDLEIKHNGNNSFITDTGSGNLYIQATNSVFLRNASGNKTALQTNDGGSVDLYHNNSKKFETSSAGVTVTGVITGGTLEATTDTAAGDNAAIGYTAAEGLILTGQGSTSDITVKNDADATVFTVPTGTDDILFPDDAKAMWGDSSDLKIYHDGSHSYIHDDGTGKLILKSSRIDLLSPADEALAVFSANGAVTLYYDNAGRFVTTSTGVKVAGDLNLGHDSDTTISRVSAGVLAVEGKNIATVDDATALAIALG